MASFHETMGWADDLENDSELTEQVTLLRAMDREQMTSEIDMAGLAMRDLATIVDSETSFEQRHLEFEMFSERLEAGEHGLMAQIVMPWADNVFGVWEVIDRDIRACEQMLSDIADRHTTPEALVNAAYWYRLAIARLQDLGDERLAVFRTIGDQPASFMADQHDSAFADTDEILLCVERASEAGRCAFLSAYERATSLGFANETHAGLRDLARFLYADATRAAHKGDAERTAQRVVDVLRMVHHLREDRTTMNALVAQHVAAFLPAHLDALKATHDLNDAMRDAITNAIDGLAGNDPFGLDAALGMDRLRLANAFGRRLPVGEMARHAVLRERIDGLGDEDVISVHIAEVAWHMLAAVDAYGAEQQLSAGDSNVSLEGVATYRSLQPLDDVIPLAQLFEIAIHGRMLRDFLLDDRRVDRPLVNDVRHLEFEQRREDGRRLRDRIMQAALAFHAGRSAGSQSHTVQEAP